MGLLAAAALGAGCAYHNGMTNENRPIVIAHRGASGYVPEHTLRAYELAIEQGADYVEPDLVMTKDGILVARHENEISATTDVAAHAEFAARKTTKMIDGESIGGWFTEDFTLAELKTLRAKERIAQLRPDNTRFDGLFEVPTFEEVLHLVAKANAANAQRKRTQRPIGIYPETKHPSYFASLGLPMEDALVKALHRRGYREPNAAVYIQSFEVGNLKKLSAMTRLPLVQLLNDSGQPYDFTLAGDARTYADLVTPAGLVQIARYANAIGVNKNLLIPRTPEGALGARTTLVSEAHAHGLRVHGWTFRAENAFLPLELRSSNEPQARGDLGSELKRFLDLGIDGFFTDQPDEGVRVAAGANVGTTPTR
jgi:glycerophosphoryl diester phosphodiesterase